MTSVPVQTLFSFEHRLARGPFWWLCIGLWVAFAILFVFLDTSLGRASTYVLYPPFLWILSALLIKRLHDRGHGASRLLLALIPVVGPLWLMVSLGFRKGTDGDNQYGPDPLLVNVDYLTVR
jgi:uncharacterized membrane protein YhaH (DUF805 family)